jgi:hypothetical protein
MDPESSLPYIQESITDPHLSHINPGRTFIFSFFEIHLNVVLPLWVGFPSRLFQFRFSD